MTKLILFWFFLGSRSALDIDSPTDTEYIIRYQVLFHSIPQSTISFIVCFWKDSRRDNGDIYPRGIYATTIAEPRCLNQVAFGLMCRFDLSV